ncbi:helix-turn-helix domain-containing protein [Hyphomicrobium sp.]|uniref:AraC-like ligand-binding domain-containing protein n=1 Tax=Hyphomicrobium sp. TaxID=82 RepID=UPI002E2F49E9|nr:helix-turn-helix domain-containing protein [Hyphomicrobium sp.]HEX2841682.1 helix-turn-helix domain-containing protein [Hyphomicrobium sp.]
MIYSTHDVHPRERLSYWREVATRGYVEHDFTPDNTGAFSGSVGITTLPGLGLASFEVDAARVNRSERYAARADCGDVLLCMQRMGETAIFQDGRETVLDGRGLFLIDPIRPFEIDLRTRSASVVVKVPRVMLEARLGNLAGLTARPVTSSSAIGTVTMGFLELLPEQAEALDDVAGLKVAEQLLDLAALTFTTGYPRGATLSSPKAVALLRLKATVERLLIEPGLKPERIAAETGISVRYANTLLAEENWSIERYMTERRLERCRHALEDAAQSHRSVGEIAFNWGFSDLSHFGRRFKARYGLTPTDYRRQSEKILAERRTSRELPPLTDRPREVMSVGEIA